MKTFTLLTNKDKEIGQGYILPSGMIALYQENRSRCIYPSMDTFSNLQKLMDRKIAQSDVGEFYLKREEDISGFSGLGIVAKGCVFTTVGRKEKFCVSTRHGNIAVMQWCTKYGSINWYEDIADIIKIHGHEGRTKLFYV